MGQIMQSTLGHRSCTISVQTPNRIHHFKLRLYQLCSGRSLFRVVMKARANHRRHCRLVRADEWRHARSLLQYSDTVAYLVLLT